MNKHFEILAKGSPDYTTLYNHIEYVRLATIKFATHLNLDIKIANYGAILHDIGKTSPIFQKRLNPEYVRSINDLPFRHEIASLFFLSLFDKSIHSELIEMVISHHMSIIKDKKDLGLFDLLIENGIDDLFTNHSKDFENWMSIALDIFECFGIGIKLISFEEAKNNLIEVIEYCKNNIFNNYGYSKWRGLLMGGDYFASSLNSCTESALNKVFNIPNLFYYHNREKSLLYPLSLKSSESNKKHTIVVAQTGCGKTDFLFRRCSGRVFYLLPFIASINAMYERVKKDINKDNEFADIRVLHSSSKIVITNQTIENKLIQSQFGSSVKITTPHQLASICFGIKGYESILLDLKDSDIILDEIHTYSNKIQGIVIKMIEILNFMNCCIHIGSATMSTSLYNKILSILGEENVYEIKLSIDEMNEYNRHIIHKHNAFDDTILKIINNSLLKNEKILIVKNRVSDSQEIYRKIKKFYPNITTLLLHSRFKRERRIELEKILYQINKKNESAIVISTQVVEVSLDISFDLLITDVAPIDSLIQRFGRINRIRPIKELKHIYLLAPPKSEGDALPYGLDVLNKTYVILPDNQLLEGKKIQELIDFVYPDIEILSVDVATIFNDGEFNSLHKLQHNSKSLLLDELGITSVSIILDSDVDLYKKSNSDKKLMLEIPVDYRSIQKLNLKQLQESKNKPFIISHNFYTNDLGLCL